MLLHESGAKETEWERGKKMKKEKVRDDGILISFVWA